MLNKDVQMNRVDAFDKVTGKAKYPGDFSYPDQLIMKVLFSKKTHAIVKNVDCAKALEIPGVIAIFTSKDVPNNEFGLGNPDQPVLCGPNSNNRYGDRVRCVADKIAIVIAESDEIAVAARDLIRVEYQDLESVTDVDRAFESNKVLLHPELGSNTLCHYKIKRGNLSEMFFGADVIVEGEYDTPVQEHAYLQPEAGIAYYDENGKITVVVGGQWNHEDQEQIAHSLNLNPEDIRVIYPAIGGAFGGREDMSVQIILGLAIMKLKDKGILRPVKIVWSREESIIGHHKRHAYKIYAKWGAKKNGKLVGAEIRILADCGAYQNTSTKVLGNATLLCTGPYFIPNVKVDAYAVLTNNMPAGAFRGFGGPQAAFEAESQINKLADALGLDPVEIRLRNTIKEGENLPVETPLPKGITIDEVIRKCAENSGWKVDKDGSYYYDDKVIDQAIKPYEKKSTGFSCGYKNVGFSFGYQENCWATIEIVGNKNIEYAVLKHSGAEVGQGAHTAFALMTATALDLPVEKIQLVMSDTSSSKNSGSVSASRMTFMAGNAIIGAAKIALENWDKGNRPAIGEYQYLAPKTSAFEPETGKCYPNFAYGYVAESVTSIVDIETGEIRIEDVCVVDDVGKVIYLPSVIGQIEGAISQALGYAVTENFIQKDGQVLTNKFSTYLIPTVLDMPSQVRSIVLEYPDPIGPFGVRGMGEMPYLPFVPALTHSLFNSTGKWFDQFPLTPEKVVNKIND